MRPISGRVQEANDGEGTTKYTSWTSALISIQEGLFPRTTGGHLKDRIKYTLNDKAKPVVEFLRDIARVQAESKKEFVALAQKALKRIEKITNPKEKDDQQKADKEESDEAKDETSAGRTYFYFSP